MINYNDGNEHKATAKEHGAAIVETLKQFINNNTPEDVELCADVLGYMGEALKELYNHEPGDVLRVKYCDNIGFIIKQ